MLKAVFLDRDGVINKASVIDGKPYPPRNLDELELIPGVDQAILQLRDRGYFCIVVTNQPDVARGKTSKETVESINQFLIRHLAIHEIISCYHDEHENCGCRKPKPGSLLKAALKYNIDLNKSFMVGDRWRDIEAGQNAGCKTFFIDYQYNEKQPQNPTYTVASLTDAVNIILNEAS
ncbi:HisB Histidinol phosphatase and related phosphatases [Candidatus Methylopumilus universalis]|uniref:D-glycero-alpha-D-manno-heptose-1,7-bisphosphate 7-phosphatase n=1 Tax=Candidatus Methylopumilus universalis TaxID=2588536 RepID=UPI003BEF0D3B